MTIDVLLKMKTFHLLISLITYLLLSSCGDEKITPDSTHINMSVIDAPFSDFPALLQSSEIPEEHRKFILSELSGSYPLVSVGISNESGTLELTIDEFLYDEWTKPKEKTSGRYPHGTKTIYQMLSKEWVSVISSNYGG